MGGQSQEASIARWLCLTGIRSAILQRVPWKSPKRNAMASGLALSMPITWTTVTPCFGTHKYLKVNYRCIPATPEALQKIRVCEGHQAYIDCPNERKIEIDYANYGRLKGAHVCGFLIAFNTNCGAESSMATVERDCTDQNSCLLEANNAKFGKDPCPLTLKYLEVHYRCRNF